MYQPKGLTKTAHRYNVSGSVTVNCAKFSTNNKHNSPRPHCPSSMLLPRLGLYLKIFRKGNLGKILIQLIFKKHFLKIFKYGIQFSFMVSIHTAMFFIKNQRKTRSLELISLAKFKWLNMGATGGKFTFLTTSFQNINKNICLRCRQALQARKFLNIDIFYKQKIYFSCCRRRGVFTPSL